MTTKASQSDGVAEGLFAIAQAIEGLTRAVNRLNGWGDQPGALEHLAEKVSAGLSAVAAAVDGAAGYLGDEE
jgi:hypothetical protein